MIQLAALELTLGAEIITYVLSAYLNIRLLAVFGKI